MLVSCLAIVKALEKGMGSNLGSFATHLSLSVTYKNTNLANLYKSEMIIVEMKWKIDISFIVDSAKF